MHKENSNALLDLLVQEFHLWQELARLTREERLALLTGEAPLLSILLKQKGDLLSHLAVLQQSRQDLLVDLASPASIPPGAPANFSIQILLSSFSEQEAGCLRHLIEGIQTLASQIGELAQGNYALADCAVKRAWTLQNWIRQEGEKTLPALLNSVLSARDLFAASQPRASAPQIASQPAWSRPYDQDFFAIALTASQYARENTSRQ